MSVHVLPDDRAREAGSRRSPNANILKDFVVTNRRLAAPPNTMGKTRPEVLTRRGTGVRGGFSSGGDGPSATRPRPHTQQGCLIPPPPLPAQMQPQAPWQLSSQQSPRSEPGSQARSRRKAPRPRGRALSSCGVRVRGRHARSPASPIPDTRRAPAGWPMRLRPLPRISPSRHPGASHTHPIRTRAAGDGAADPGARVRAETRSAAPARGRPRGLAALLRTSEVP